VQHTNDLLHHDPRRPIPLAIVTEKYFWGSSGKRGCDGGAGAVEKCDEEEGKKR